MGTQADQTTSGEAAGTRRGRRTTLQDIARELNVSTSLVSKVLNRRLGQSSASREKIKAIFAKAQELDYQKNAMATALVQGRQNAMAVYMHQHGVAGSELTSSTVKGVAAQAGRLQQRLMLQYYDTPEQFTSLIQRAHLSLVDGLILIGIELRESSEALAQLLERRMPVVTVYDHQVHSSFPNIAIDQREVGRMATVHLVERGCRRVGFLSTTDNAERFKGYQLTLREAGLPCDEQLVARTRSYDALGGEQAIRAWRQTDIEFDGLVCGSDQLAAGAINVLMREGVNIPQDVKLVGIDNSPFCQFYIVPITSVSQEVFDRGELAVRTLFHLTRDEPAPDAAIGPKLHIRASSGG